MRIGFNTGSLIYSYVRPTPSSPIGPVLETVSAGHDGNETNKDSERKRDDHLALAAEFSRKMGENPPSSATSEGTSVQISDEGRALLQAEQTGLFIGLDRMPTPANIGIANYLAIQSLDKK